jgi:hypothetical protein
MVAAGTGCRWIERLRQQRPAAPGDGNDSQCQRAGRGSQLGAAPAMTLRLDFWTATMIRHPSARQRPCPRASRIAMPIPMDGLKEPCHAR